MATQIGGTIVWNLDVDDSKFQSGLNKAKAAASDFSKNTDKEFTGLQQSITNSFQKATAASQLFAAGLGVVGGALVAASGFGIKYAADLETMTQGFITLLGSAEKANEAISMIQKDAAKTPFEFKGLVDANFMLTSVTKNAQRSEGLLLNIGKALTASGKSGAELDRIIVNLQQIANVGKITELDIRQFGFAGINILELLADYYGTTKEAASEMIKGSSDAFKDLEGAFEKAGTGGGRFARAFIDQAGTMNQLWSNFKDNIGITASQLVKSLGIFDAVKGALKGLVDGLAFFATPEGTAKIVEFFNVLRENAPIVIGLILGGLAPAFWALAAPIIASTLHLLPFIAAGVALGALVQFLVKEMGGWGKVMEMVRAGFQAAGQAYNTYLKPGIDALASEIKTNLLPALTELWTQLKPILIPVLQVLGKLLGAVIVVAIQNFILQLRMIVAGVTLVAQAISTFITFVQNLPTALVNIWTSVTTTIQNAISASVAAVLSLPAAIGNMLAQMVLDFATFLGFVVGLFVYGIPAAIQATVDFFVALPGRIFATLTSTYNAIVTGWTNIWNWLRTVVPQIIESIVQFFATLPTRIGEWLNNTKTRTSTGFQDIWNAIIAEVSTWPSRLYDWGANIANAFVDGIKSAIGKIVDAFKGGLDKAKKLVQGNSPPVAGPFKNIDVWGYNVGMAWVGGIQKAIGGLNFDNPFDMILPSPAPVPAVAQQGNRGIEKLVNIEHMEIRDEADITGVSRELGFIIENSTGFNQNG